MFTTKLNITRVIKRLLSLELERLELEFRGLAESNELRRNARGEDRPAGHWWKVVGWGKSRRQWGAAKVGRELVVAAGAWQDIEDVGRRTV